MSPKLGDPIPPPPANSHAPDALTAFANAITRMRTVMAAHPEWTPEQVKAKVDSYPDTRPPPQPQITLEQVEALEAPRYDPDADVPCCPREAGGLGSFNTPPCDCQRLYH